jgi:RNA polymerase sigma-70 factor (family 1)
MAKANGDGLGDESGTLLKMKNGDVSAFDEIYLHYGPRIYRNILRLVKDEALAEEVLQDVFLRIWQKRHSLEVETSFKSYLFRIAHNLVIDLFRRAAFDRDLLTHLSRFSAESYSNTEEITDLKDAEMLLTEAIDALPPQRKKIFLLCKMEGKTYSEVSDLLGISQSTISDHIVKATKSVKSHFKGNNFIIIMAAISISAYN